MNRNLLYLLLGGLIVVVAVLGYTTYQDRKEPQGLQIKLGKDGVEVKGN